MPRARGTGDRAAARSPAAMVCGVVSGRTRRASSCQLGSIAFDRMRWAPAFECLPAIGSLIVRQHVGGAVVGSNFKTWPRWLTPSSAHCSHHSPLVAKAESAGFLGIGVPGVALHAWRGRCARCCFRVSRVHCPTTQRGRYHLRSTAVPNRVRAHPCQLGTGSSWPPRYGHFR